MTKTAVDVRVQATFVPQVWIGDHAVEAGEPVSFDVTDQIVAAGPAGFEIADDSYEADALWQGSIAGVASTHSGPFKVLVAGQVRAFYETLLAEATGEEVTMADTDGQFLLADETFGNPGCDGCGAADAVARVGVEYVCADAVFEMCGDVIPTGFGEAPVPVDPGADYAAAVRVPAIDVEGDPLTWPEGLPAVRVVGGGWGRNGMGNDVIEMHVEFPTVTGTRVWVFGDYDGTTTYDGNTRVEGWEFGAKVLGLGDDLQAEQVSEALDLLYRSYVAAYRDTIRQASVAVMFSVAGSFTTALTERTNV
jgi:hypothetical protein